MSVREDIFSLSKFEIFSTLEILRFEDFILRFAVCLKAIDKISSMGDI